MTLWHFASHLPTTAIGLTVFTPVLDQVYESGKKPPMKTTPSIELFSMTSYQKGITRLWLIPPKLNQLFNPRSLGKINVCKVECGFVSIFSTL
jgi:hypothetical protein